MNNNSMIDPNMFYSNNPMNNLNSQNFENQNLNRQFRSSQNNVSPSRNLSNNIPNSMGTQPMRATNQNNPQGINQQMNNITQSVNDDLLPNNVLSELPQSNMGSLINPQQSLGSQAIDNAMANNMFPLFDQTFQITQDKIQYMNGFIGMNIGRNVNVEFLIGNNNLIQKSGTLVGVGRDYILLAEYGTDDIIACKFDDIKFITFLEN